ncbi:MULTISPECIES: CmpA/NrtA family ABC transporter substrate-binding protein [Paraburkholderia]|uniref:Nitrate/nitrite transport system substrate-binding protein n=1 Tax=Paraburkholderia tropica TaxID=92647 RepID=A0A1A5X2X5_9BURK|nr:MULTISPECIES: CmpA/NrtA family ABC transporter substrate-binding protein [Paraburkholderia]MBB2984407.1 nitrate/nitrite transport system substrate-binding protein [Paraburkholderia tropica]MBN3810697.1 ABC transporter substrate-binding protein [Paraburkholderia sp. Ac-20347]MDE1140303.1 CmpA/NrtA family ABC transporter substrate-binding protein [Paraburkholderia tropica]OBR47689.1 nitrate ABC transporter substrate-binding protein [Paraburkholderia tropica]PXX18234.1 nitrate/nitrite transpor
MNESTRAAAPPEKTHLKIGFVPLADAAPVVAAKLLEFGHAHGLTLELSRQPSWAALRDKLLAGELDAAHSLYGLVYGVQLGIGGPQTDMAALMVLNRNGQAISLSNRLADALAEHGTLPRALATLGRTPVFAQTFPTGTHAMWLYYWLASQGVHPLRDIESVVIPPPQMVAALAEERLDGLCVGEPWPSLAQRRGMGRTVIRSGEIWPDHPEKVLACRRDFVTRYPNTARALVSTMLEACRWLDGAGHRKEIAQWLARPEMLGVDAALIAERLEGEGLPDAVRMKFFSDGTVNIPLESEGMWFFTQFERWGMMARRDDYRQLAAAINQTALYRQAAAAIGVAVPETFDAPVFVDGRKWDSADPAGYVDGFEIKA